MLNVQTTEGYPFIMLLELIYKVSFKLKRGKVIIHIDRRNLIWAMTAVPTKLSQYVQDCRAIKSRFDKIKKKLDIDIIVKYSSKEIKEKEEFKDNRGKFLILECDTQSKLIR